MVNILYQGKALALYGQVALLDAEDTDSYPRWPEEKSGYVFGTKGVAVTALIDNWIELVVYENVFPDKAIYYGSGELKIGNSGIIVGNVIANTLADVHWLPGKTRVDIYANSAEDTATQISFVLTKIADN